MRHLLFTQDFEAAECLQIFLTQTRMVLAWGWCSVNFAVKRALADTESDE